MVYFISGHRDLSYEDFEKYYIPEIEHVLDTDNDAEFIVGDYIGGDKFAMDYIFNHTSAHLTICHINKRPMNTPENSVYDDNNNMHDIGINYIRMLGGTDISRDTYMTNHSDFDIAFVKDNRWDSGTAQNIQRRHNIK